MTYEARKHGFSVTRLILTGFSGFTNGIPNQVFGFAHSNVLGQFVTHRATLDHVTVQLPHPRGDAFPDLFWDTFAPIATPPGTPAGAGGGFFPRNIDDASGLNAVADFRFWDIADFLALPDFNTPALRIQPWGDGVAGNGGGSAPPIIRASDTGSYIVKVHKNFENGLLAWFRNPERLAQVTHGASVGAFLPGDDVTGNLGGRGFVLSVPANTRTIFMSGLVLSHFQVGEIITGAPSGATAVVGTYHAQLAQQLMCQVNGVYSVREED